MMTMREDSDAYREVVKLDELPLVYHTTNTPIYSLLFHVEHVIYPLILY